MAQSAMRTTLGFGSGRDLTVPQLEPHIGLGTESVELVWDSLSSPPGILSLSALRSLSPSL